jgi:hypothetical protein
MEPLQGEERKRKKERKRGGRKRKRDTWTVGGLVTPLHSA